MVKKKINFDVKTHILVPKHIKISQKEKKELFNKLNITIKELPKIFVTDPVLADMNVEVGDIIKIIRQSPTAGEAIYYRGVVNE